MHLSSSLPSFKNGIHPLEHKDTAHIPVERMPFVRYYILPLGQHIGAPSKALVQVGAKVQRGQLLAKASSFVSANLHSPVTGTVVSIDRERHPNGQLVPSIKIEADPYSTQEFVPKEKIDWRQLTPAEFVEHIQSAGIVGMGGAAFPTHVKYAIPDGKYADTLVINGCECEPYLTCDHRLMVERPEAILQGIEIIMEVLKLKRAAIGVENNKPDAIEQLRKHLKERNTDKDISVVPLQVKYPQGAEKMLINAVYGKEVPAGKLPVDIGMIVNNVGTMAAIADYFETGKPLIERFVSITGNGVSKPSNLIVPIGTPVRDVLEHCGLSEKTTHLVMGGPMMGSALSSLDVPVLKGTSGLLAFVEETIENRVQYPCIRCGRCLDACANFLNPSRLARLAQFERYEGMEDYYIWDCMECGACSYVCPSNIPIVQLIRVGKSALRDKKRKGTT